jgi:hypothetical protein
MLGAHEAMAAYKRRSSRVLVVDTRMPGDESVWFEPLQGVLSEIVQPGAVLGACSPILRESWHRSRDIANALGNRVLGADVLAKGEDVSAKDIGSHGILTQIGVTLQYALTLMTQVGAASAGGVPIVFERTDPTHLLPFEMKARPGAGAGSSSHGTRGADRVGHLGTARVGSINLDASPRHLNATARARLGKHEVWLLIYLDHPFAPRADRGRYPLKPVNDVAVAAAQAEPARANAADAERAGSSPQGHGGGRGRGRGDGRRGRGDGSGDPFTGPWRLMRALVVGAEGLKAAGAAKTAARSAQEAAYAIPIRTRDENTDVRHSIAAWRLAYHVPLEPGDIPKLPMSVVVQALGCLAYSAISMVEAAPTPAGGLQRRFMELGLAFAAADKTCWDICADEHVVAVVLCRLAAHIKEARCDGFGQYPGMSGGAGLAKTRKGAGGAKTAATTEEVEADAAEVASTMAAIGVAPVDAILCGIAVEREALLRHVKERCAIWPPLTTFQEESDTVRRADVRQLKPVREGRADVHVHIPLAGYAGRDDFPLALQTGGFQALAGIPSVSFDAAVHGSMGDGRAGAAAGGFAHSSHSELASLDDEGEGGGGLQGATCASSGRKAASKRASHEAAPGAWRLLLHRPAVSAALTSGTGPVAVGASGPWTATAANLPHDQTYRATSVADTHPEAGGWLRDEAEEVVASNTACMVDALLAAASEMAAVQQPRWPLITNHQRSTTADSSTGTVSSSSSSGNGSNPAHSVDGESYLGDVAAGTGHSSAAMATRPGEPSRGGYAGWLLASDLRAETVMALSASAVLGAGGHSAAAMATRPGEPSQGGYAGWLLPSDHAYETVMAQSASAGLRSGSHPAGTMATRPGEPSRGRYVGWQPPSDHAVEAAMALSASAVLGPGGHSAAAMAARPGMRSRGGYAGWPPPSDHAYETVMAQSATARSSPDDHSAASSVVTSAPPHAWDTGGAVTDLPIGQKRPRSHVSGLQHNADRRPVDEGRRKLQRRESSERAAIDGACTRGEHHLTVPTTLMALQPRPPNEVREHSADGLSTQPRLRSLADSTLASATVAKLRSSMRGDDAAARCEGPLAQPQGAMRALQHLIADSGASGRVGAGACAASAVARNTSADTLLCATVGSPGGTLSNSWRAARGERVREQARRQPSGQSQGRPAAAAGCGVDAGARRVHEGGIRSQHRRELPTFQRHQHTQPHDPPPRAATTTADVPHERVTTPAPAGANAAAPHGELTGKGEVTALAFSRVYARVYIPCRVVQGHDSAAAHRTALMLANIETKLDLPAESTARLPHAAAYAVSTFCDPASSSSAPPGPRHSVSALDVAISLAVPPIAFEVCKAVQMAAGNLDGVPTPATAVNVDGSASSGLADSCSGAPHASVASTVDTIHYRSGVQQRVGGAGPASSTSRPARPRPGGEVFWLKGLGTLPGRSAAQSAGHCDAGDASASRISAVPDITSSTGRRL